MYACKTVRQEQRLEKAAMAQNYNPDKKSNSSWHMPGTWEVLNNYLLTHEKEQIITEKNKLFKIELSKPVKNRR